MRISVAQHCFGWCYLLGSCSTPGPLSARWGLLGFDGLGWQGI